MSRGSGTTHLSFYEIFSLECRVSRFVPRPALQSALVLLGISTSATAQQSDNNSAQPRPPAALIQEAKEYYGIGSVPDHCADNEGNPDDIVVCAKPRTDQRLPIEEPVSGKVDSKMTAVGVNPGPNGIPIKGCFLQKCPKELYIIDVKALPEAPPGSDADLIARGEM